MSTQIVFLVDFMLQIQYLFSQLQKFPIYI